MQLADAWIHGIRRFGGDRPHRLRIDTKLVCLIGANEAGKSTVLDALSMARHGGAVEPQDRSRRQQVPDDRDAVRLKYRLDLEDAGALTEIESDEDVSAIHWFEVVYRADGARRTAFEPYLRRPRGPRRTVLDRLRRAIETWYGDRFDEDDLEEDADVPDRALVRTVVDALSQDPEDLPDEVITRLRELANEVDRLDEAFATELRTLADDEHTQHPHSAASEVLWARCPEFVRFGENARRLESEYDLNQAADNPDEALRNLAALAHLDLRAMRDAVQRNETGTVRDVREAANRVLEQRFLAWRQHPGVTVALENDASILRIHVQSGTGPTMSFHERSDGLRQFVALVALTAQHARAVPPILLIDEIETHLHYDAQADLIAVLAEQTAVSQVIYTTHSAACLPEDLGLGVRVVQPVAEETASTIRQNFWQDENPGIGALLMAMGAASLALVPLRPAVIAEGGSDLVLLPSLLREAIRRDHLGFAIVPGSSSAPPDRIAGLDLQGVRTAWVLDADDGGRRRRNALVAANIPGDNIFLLADDADLEIEDLIDPATYSAAVNAYASDLGGTAVFTVDELPSMPCQRHDAVVVWCKKHSVRPPGKVAIANKVVEQSTERPLLDQAHAERLQALQRQIEEILLESASTTA